MLIALRPNATCVGVVLLLAAVLTTGCAPADTAVHLTFSGSALGPEAEAVRLQLDRFARTQRGVQVELRVTPDAADQRRQLYVQWLNGRATEPDILQLDVVWTAEFAAAGWILPLTPFEPDVSDFIPASVAAAQWRNVLYAIPWFVDVGMLYRRTDIAPGPPQSLADLRDAARAAIDTGRTRYGLVWQGARYEGLVTVFLEHLSAFGGGILDSDGDVIVDRPEAIRALTFMRDAVAADQIVPSSALTWQEEQVRFAFQNGDALFMRNWPYAWVQLQDDARSRVAGRVAVGPFPAAGGGRPAATLGGAQLAINAHTREPALAWELVDFLTAPEQMLERARLVSQLPPRRSLYQTGALAGALPIPIDAVHAVLDAAVARPVTPVYTELSEILQVRIHRALTGQQSADAALRDGAKEIRTLLARAGLSSATEVR